MDRAYSEAAQQKWDAMMVTNPAAVIHDDGSVLLYYKAVAHDRGRFAYGVAKAESLTSSFQRLRDDPILAGSQIRQITRMLMSGDRMAAII